MSTKDDLLAQIAIIDKANARSLALAQSLPDDTPTIKTAADFDKAYAAAVPGDALMLDPTFAYSPAFVLDKNNITLTTPSATTTRQTIDRPLPTFLHGLTIVGQAANLLSVDVRNAMLTDILTVSGSGFVGDAIRVLGDPTSGGKRGIAGNAANLTLMRAYVGQIFRAGQDTQAFAAWDSPGPFHLEDGYFEASGETILFGGSDEPMSTNVPSDIKLLKSTLTKNPAWQAAGYQVKNVLELKSARRMLVQGCDLSYAWSGYTQDGYLLVITPRNQDGGSPWVSVEDITITDNDFSEGAGWIQMLGTDYSHPSGPLNQITISKNRVKGLNPGKYAQPWAPIGNPKIIIISVLNALPSAVTIDGNSVAATNTFNMAAALELDGDPPTKMPGFSFTNNLMPATWYGLHGQGAGVDLTLNDPNGSALTMFTAGGVVGGNQVVGS
jgi:hypothetical protein